MTFVLHFLLFDFRNFKIAQPRPRHVLGIHVSREYFISTNKDDSPRAEAGNYQKEIPNVEILKNGMDGQTQPRRLKNGLTESRKVWRFDGKIQLQKTKIERRK